MLPELAVASLLILLLYQWNPTSKKVRLPRLGPPTFFGYIWTAVRSTLAHPKLIEEGRDAFAGRPFVLPTLGGSFVVVGPEFTEFLQRCDDSVFSQLAALEENLVLHLTMDEHQLSNPWHLPVLRTDFTRAIPTMIPHIYEEAVFVLDDALTPRDGSDSVTVPMFHTMTHLVGRISNRGLVGLPLCRDLKYIDAVVHFANGVVPYSHILKWCPFALRRACYSFLHFFFGGKTECFAFLVPFLENYIRERENMAEKPIHLVEFLVRAAPPEEISNPTRLAMRIMNMNFGSIHTSSIFLTHSLFHLATLTEEQLEEIRVEVRQALEDEGGWCKTSIAKFRKIDSLVKEVGRIYPLSGLGLSHRTVKDGTLPDGTVVPAGYSIYLDLAPIHMNPEVYPNPEVFDPFRFSTLREKADSDLKHGLTMVDRNYLPFNIGRHACPGRFFAAMEIKIMIAYLLLHYDLAFADGSKTVPPPLYFDAAIIPDLRTKMVFRRRSPTSDVF